MSLIFGRLSAEKPNPSGVPHGSALSPLLFDIYTMDLPSSLKTHTEIRVAAYADDVKIYAAYGPNEASVLDNLKLSVQNMKDWANAWSLNLNISKSCILRLGRDAINYDYGISLSSEQKVCDLGITLNSSLSYSFHIDKIATNASRIMYCLLRNAHTNDLSTLIRLYKAYVLPVLEYCSPVWNPVMKKDITKLEKVQRAFTRILFYRAFPSKQYPRLLPDYKTRLEVLGLKSLFYRRVLADLMMSFKIIKNEIKLKHSCFWVFLPTSSRRFSINLTVPRYRGWRSRVYQQSFA